MTPRSGVEVGDTAAVVADGLRRSFGAVRALDGVSLRVGQGEVVGLLGHNGAGKTTTVRLLTGILAPNAGTVRVHGRDPQVDGPAVRRATGVVSAVPAVDDRLTARQNLRFVGEVFGVDQALASTRGEALLERLGLGERADERVGGFSSGMRQRLALARALLPDPTLLLLDEPTATLDPVASRDVRDLLAHLARAEGRSVLLCSHNLAEAQALCDRVVVLEHGRVIADGRPAALAAQLGVGSLRVDVDPADAARAEQVLHAAGGTVASGPRGKLAVTGLTGDAVPLAIAALVRADVRIHAVVPEDAALEDVYFALHAQGPA
jgi:ABC-2 type transport system ATP-binding protein